MPTTIDWLESLRKAVRMVNHDPYNDTAERYFRRVLDSRPRSVSKSEFCDLVNSERRDGWMARLNVRFGLFCIYETVAIEVFPGRDGGPEEFARRADSFLSML